MDRPRRTPIYVTALSVAVSKDGEYRGSFVPDELGAYRVDVLSRGRTDSLRAEPRVAMVADRGIDFLNAEMRSPLLRRIAEETGGRFYTVSIQALGPGEAFGWSSLLDHHDTLFQVRARERRNEARPRRSPGRRVPRKR